jgi:hypothetical protein
MVGVVPDAVDPSPPAHARVTQHAMRRNARVHRVIWCLTWRVKAILLVGVAYRCGGDRE